MNDGFDKLLLILDAELAKYRNLLDLARRKADLLSSRAPVQDIEHIVSEEASLIDEVIRYEQARLEVMLDITAGLGLLPMASVNDLAATVGGKVGGDLAQLGTVTTRVLTELRKVNRLNEALLAQELALVNFSLDIFTNRGLEGAGTYSGPMRSVRSSGQGSAILDVKA